MQNDNPVFRDAGHALHVSFLIHSQPASSISPTALVIAHLQRENPPWDGLEAQAARSVNFSGLSPTEVRGQCAQVVAMVEHLPHHAERDALKAAYGHQVIKADGVRGMAAYCAPAIDCHHDMALYVAWHVFMTARQRDQVTLEDVATKFGVTIARVRHAASITKRYGRALHARGVDALTDRFLAGRLIAEEVAV